VAEGARLESVFARNGDVGSNPTLSATYRTVRGSAMIRMVQGFASHFTVLGSTQHVRDSL
jgi:hypothetical protein